MTGQLLAGTELTIQPERPRQDQLPDGWHIVGWDIAAERWTMDRIVAWSVCLRFAHEAGVSAEVEWRTYSLPLEYDWLRAWLIGSQHMPKNVAARVEGPGRPW